MSHTVFMAALTSLLLVAFAAVYVYVYTSAVDQPAVRQALTLGIPRALAWVDPRGLHRAPRGYVPPVPLVRAVAQFAPGSLSLEATVILPVAPLLVRVAEILAHTEDEQRAMAGPQRTDDGATEEWSPRGEVAAVAPPPAALAHAEPDAEERAILAALEDLVAEQRKAPTWLVAWQREVDAHYEAADLDADGHRRWRATAWEIPTGELPQVRFEPADA